jgi:hypothetical protein
MAPHLVHQFWGSNSDAVSQLLVREVILAEEVSMAYLSTGLSVTWRMNSDFVICPKAFSTPIKGVLFRVRVEPAKQTRGRHFCDHAQDFVPLLKHNLVIRTASGLDLPTDGGRRSVQRR